MQIEGSWGPLKTWTNPAKIIQRFHPCAVEWNQGSLTFVRKVICGTPTFVDEQQEEGTLKEGLNGNPFDFRSGLMYKN